MVWKLLIDEEVQGVIREINTKEKLIEEISLQLDNDVVEIVIKKRVPRDNETRCSEKI